MDVRSWLQELGLERYAEAFASNGIESGLLPDLTNEDLKDLGVERLADRKAILTAISSLPAAADSAARKPEPTRVRGAAERRQLTVLFADLVGSTALSATLDPEDMREVIRVYQNAVAGEISRFEGHVAKFMGDGVLAYFGFPRAHEDAAERAVRAGLAIAGSVGRLATPSGESLAVRIGIATGLVVVGDLIGEGAAQEEAVIGETPNLAARVQALADPGAVVVSETSQRLLGDLFESRALGAHRLKGVAKPHRLWRVLSERAAASRFEALRSGSLSPFIGREREMALLLERWAEAKDGEGQVVQLSGEAGIGKSRMIGALLDSLAQEPHAAMRYQCSPHHVNSALHPVIRQLEHAAGIAADEEPDVKYAKLAASLRAAGEECKAAAPLIAALLSIPSDGCYPAAHLEPQQQKRLTLAALANQIMGLAAHRPVLMVVEDLHWADPTTLEFLESVLSRTADAAVLVVLTCRPEFEGPWGGYSHVTVLTLNRLTRRQSESLVQALTGGKHLPDQVREQIITKTDGMPLFVEELTKDVLESKLLREDVDGYALTGPLTPLTIPSSLQDSLMARLDRLGSAKDVAQIGAAIGREFSYRLLIDASGWSDGRIEVALGQLIAAQLIFKRGTAPEASYVFKHALVQDIAHASLLKGRRRELHSKIAESLEARQHTGDASEPEILAYHFSEADSAERAIFYWQQAGEKARQGSNYVEASRHFTQAIALVPKLPPQRAATTELDLQMALGEMYRATKGSGSPQTAQVFDRARALCDKLADKQRIFHVVYGQFISDFNRPKLRDALAHADELAHLRPESEDLEAAITADHMIGTTRFLLGDLVGARRYLEQALRPRDADQDRLVHYSQGNFPSGALTYLSWALFALGYPDQAQQRRTEAVEAGKATSSFIHAMCLSNACALDHFRRDADAMKSHAAAALAIAEEKGVFLFSQHARSYLGWVKTQAGDRSGLLDTVDALKTARSSGQEVEVPHDLAILAESYLAAGDGKGALRCVDEALAIVEKTEERWYEAELHTLMARLLAQAGESGDRPEQHYRHAMNVARAQEARMWELRAATGLAQLWRAQGKAKAARELLAPAHDWFTEGHDLPNLVEARQVLEDLSS